MSEPFNTNESERMIHAFANRVMRRLVVGQAIMSREDVVQELWTAWCHARNAYDADRGIPWAAFLQRGMKNHINRQIERHLERFQGQTNALSLDAKTDDENGATLAEVIPGNAPNPSDEVERLSNYRKAIDVMSDRAKMFVSILREQPPELLNEVLVSQDKAEHAAKIGAPFNAPRRITSAMVFDLMGAPRIERTRITREVQQLGERLSK